MIEYVRITGGAGEYTGYLGTIRNRSSSGGLVVVELDTPDGPWDGIALDAQDVEFLTRKEYFRAKLYFDAK